MTDEEYAALNPLVAGCAIAIHRRFPMVPRDDIAQTGWEWVLKYPKKVAEYLEMEEALGSAHLSVALRNYMRKFADAEKAKTIGYDVSDLAWYTQADLVKLLLPAVFDRDAWLYPPKEDNGGGKNYRDPAEGNNWLAMLCDVARAVDKLPDEQQRLLRMYYRDGLTQTAVGWVLGVSQQDVSTRHRRILNRLVDLLGGEKYERVGDE